MTAPTANQDDAYLIWSNEHNAWWGPDRCGYRQSIEQAGRYSLPEALRCCDLRSKVTGHLPSEVVQPSPELLTLLAAPPTERAPEPEVKS